jgi:hypothetical protein
MMSKKTEPADAFDPAFEAPVKARAYDERYLDNPKNPRRRAGDAASAPVIPVPYPAYRYHIEGHSVIVKNAEEDKALGEGWTDKPKPPDEARAYPSWRYHASKPPVLVINAAEDANLGPGWYLTVHDAAASVPRPTPPPQTAA